ncbi:MAG: deoxyribodipyrimidine photo-lyase [Myxococcaceae bacterium]|nr:deoxyribodipyrimidine photo-lyase [Myxococcaceae bacterium]MBH2006815.1 deoxyribodipyrimidine photo-lyase [Myxococcaceae bacterium]
MQPIHLVWFRQDLRLFDNPALQEASRLGRVLPIYIRDPEAGAASQSWVTQSLSQLNKHLSNHLRIFEGQPLEIIQRLIRSEQISGVFWNRRYDPIGLQQDKVLKHTLREQGIRCDTFNASLLFEPWQTQKKDGTPYRVFTPFYRNLSAESPPPRKPLPAPKQLQLHWISPEKELEALPAWALKVAQYWTPGEDGAQQTWDRFCNSKLSAYELNRDYPALSASSCLAPYLHFGEISPNAIWWDIHEPNHPFIRQLIWREFAHSILFDHPHTACENYQSAFDSFPWQDSSPLLERWQKGLTGIPLVDAGMRELWETGTMHNRVRMVVGSFLTKNLLIHWKRGLEWFSDCLVDADLANNAMGWQWVAGSGVDAAPFFRIFNPTTQAKTFDPAGEYIKRFVPELRHLTIAELFEPWKSKHPPRTYPKPVVDLAESREKALRYYKQLR